MSFLTEAQSVLGRLLDTVRYEYNVKKGLCEHSLGICYCKERQAIEDGARILAHIDKLVEQEEKLPKW